MSLAQNKAIDKMIKEKMQIQLELDEVTKALDATQTTMDRLEAENNQLLESYGEMQSQIDAIQKKLDDTAEELSEANKEIDILTTKVDYLQPFEYKNKELEDELTLKNESISKAETTITDQLEQLKVKDDRIEELLKLMKDMENVEQMKTDNYKLTKSNQELITNKSEFEVQIKELKDELKKVYTDRDERIEENERLKLDRINIGEGRDKLNVDFIQQLKQEQKLRDDVTNDLKLVERKLQEANELREVYDLENVKLKEELSRSIALKENVQSQMNFAIEKMDKEASIKNEYYAQLSELKNKYSSLQEEYNTRKHQFESMKGQYDDLIERLELMEIERQKQQNIGDQRFESIQNLKENLQQVTSELNQIKIQANDYLSTINKYKMMYILREKIIYKTKQRIHTSEHERVNTYQKIMSNFVIAEKDKENSTVYSENKDTNYISSLHNYESNGDNLANFINPIESYNANKEVSFGIEFINNVDFNDDSDELERARDCNLVLMRENENIQKCNMDLKDKINSILHKVRIITNENFELKNKLNKYNIAY